MKHQFYSLQLGGKKQYQKSVYNYLLCIHEMITQGIEVTLPDEEDLAVFVKALRDDFDEKERIKFLDLERAGIEKYEPECPKHGKIIHEEDCYRCWEEDK